MRLCSPRSGNTRVRSWQTPKRLLPPLSRQGWRSFPGGTDSHLMLVDLRSMRITGRDAEKSLERAGITCNKNGVPVRPGKAYRDLGRSFGLACGNDARLRTS